MTDDGKEKAAARILICDDELLVAEDMALTLRDLGYETAGMVATGEEAIRKAEEVRPDLILMDINLAGEIDGIEAVEQIRAQFDIPVIYLTAYAEEDVFERAKQTEPYGYVGKPVRLLELRYTLETALYKHQADRRIRESEERFRKVFEQGPIGMGLVGTDGRFLVVNPQLRQMLGYTEDELTRFTFVDITHPDHVTQDLEAVRRLYAGEIPYYKAEKRYIKKDGDIRWGNLTAAAIRNAEGKLLYTLPMIEDITDRKRAEEALRESEEKLRLVTENIEDVFWMTTPGIQEMIYVSPAYERIWGRTRASLYESPKSFMESIHPEDREQLLRVVEEHQERAWTCEYRIVRPDGTIRWIHDRGYPILDESGNLRLRTGVSTDITDRKKAEDGLRESERKYRVLFEGAPVGIFQSTIDGRVLRVNPAYAHMYGYASAEEAAMLIDKVAERIYVEPERRKKLIDLALRTDGFVKAENQYRKKDGSLFWGQLYFRVVRDRDGEVKHLEGFVEDINERKRAEEALRSLSDFRQTLIDSIPNPVFYKDIDGKYIGCNEAFAALVGLPKGKVVGRSVFEVVPQDLADLWREKDLELFDRPQVQVFECTLSRPDGTERSLVFHKAPIFDADGGLAGLIGVVVDITDRLRAEEAVRQSEEWYRALVENSFDGIFIQKDFKIIFANSRLHEMLGYSPEELEGLDYRTIYHPDYRELTSERATARMRGEDVVSQYEVKLQRKDGTCFDGEISARAVRVKGEPGVQVWVKDVSKRKRSEEAQRRLATAVEQAVEAIVVTDTAGNIQYVNPAFERISGYTRDEAIGKTPKLLKSGEHYQAFYKHLWETIKRGEVWTGRFINKRKDGSLYQEESTISPVRDSSGKIVNFVAVKRDITEHLDLSRQLLQAQKMEAIGTLAGGIAHDFNNLLQVTLGYSELLLAEKRGDDPEYADLSKIFQAARSGAELVRRLLTFSRKVESKPIPLNLNRQIDQVEKLLRRTIPKMIEIQLDLSGDLPEINADPTQMEQILMNLAVNARDAMLDRGKLTVGTKNVTLDEEYCRIHGAAKPGEYVLLTVSDTGHGMDEATIEHIFEPFYTTKELGRGTGLGLAMVYGIVKQHGGYISCYSEAGHGTTFEVYFPAIEKQVELDAEKTGVMPAFGTETILLVDDEEFVRDLGARILSKAGYSVLTATNGRKALDLFEKERTQISLVILDLIMPEMGGNECLRELRKIDPQLKVLIASGLSTDPSTKESVEMGTRGFVSKPFRMKELLRQVRQVLDEG